jgi:hypothetical protein
LVTRIWYHSANNRSTVIIGRKRHTVMTFGREELEPVVFVEGLCILVFGVGDDGEGSDLA